MILNEKLIEPLFVRAEHYGKSSLELIKLKSIDKFASVLSILISRGVLLTVLLVFVLTLNVGVSLWLGELIGKNYLGFMAVAAFYGVAALIVNACHPYLKSKFNNMIIRQMLH